MELIAQDGGKEGGREAGDVAGPGKGLATLMDEFAHGTIVVAVDGRVLHANQAGRHEIARGRVVMQRSGILQACRADCDTELHLALSRAAEGKRSLLDLESIDGPGLPAAIVPLKVLASAPHAIAVILARSEVCDPTMLSFFCRQHGLTPTEQQVLGLLCSGTSGPQVARRLRIAVSTVRSHIRSICAKTHAASVRELVARIAVLPPVAPSFPHDVEHPATVLR